MINVFFFCIYLVIFVVILFEYVITVVIRSHGCVWVQVIVSSPPHLHGLRCNKGERSRVPSFFVDRYFFTSLIAATIYSPSVIVSGLLYSGMKSSVTHNPSIRMDCDGCTWFAHHCVLFLFPFHTVSQLY